MKKCNYCQKEYCEKNHFYETAGTDYSKKEKESEFLLAVVALLILFSFIFMLEKGIS